MFTTEQLELIKAIAKRSKNQGELSVYKKLSAGGQDNIDFTLTQLNVVRYIAEECKRQHSGEMSVYDMANAWTYAANWWAESDSENERKITLTFIANIGTLVEPIDNKHGFRTIPIFVGNTYFGYQEKADFREVKRLLTLLLESYYEGLLEPTHPKAKIREDQFYYEFENVHGFVDGNGRVGKVIFNYLKGTLENPEMPPNFWDSNNP